MRRSSLQVEGVEGADRQMQQCRLGGWCETSEQAGDDLEVGVVAVSPRPDAALLGGMVGRLLGV